MLAAKFFDDHYFNNAFYAKVGGVPSNEMNSLEVEFLFMVNFSLYCAMDTYKQYYTELWNHTLHGTCGCAQRKSTRLPLLLPSCFPLFVADRPLAPVPPLSFSRYSITSKSSEMDVETKETSKASQGQTQMQTESKGASTQQQQQQQKQPQQQVQQQQQQQQQQQVQQQQKQNSTAAITKSTANKGTTIAIPNAKSNSTEIPMQSSPPVGAG